VGQTEAPDQDGTADGRLTLIYGQYASSLRKRCFRLTGDAAAAEDLMQEVFTRFLARFGELPVSLNVHGYLLATAHNIWMNQLRRDGHVRLTEIDESRTPDDRIENDPVRTLLLAEQRTEVQHGAAGLTERQRRALALRELEGRTYGEIGADMGLATNAVAQVVWRARTQLRRSLRRSQIDIDALPVDCRARLDALSDLVDAHVTNDTAALEAHMADCRDCRRAFAAYQEAGWRLRGVAPFVPLVAIIARIGAVLRAGVEVPAGIGAAAAVTAAVVATTGGGAALVSHDAASSSSRAIRPPTSMRSPSHPRPGNPALSAVTSRAANSTGSSRSLIERSSPGGTGEGPFIVKPVALAIAFPLRPAATTPPTTAPGPTPASPPMTVDQRPALPPGKIKKHTRDATPPPGQGQLPAVTKTPPGQRGAHKKSHLAKMLASAKKAGDHTARKPAAIEKTHPTKRDASTTPSAAPPKPAHAHDKSAQANGKRPTTPPGLAAPASGDTPDAASKPHGHPRGKPTPSSGNAIVPAAPQSTTPDSSDSGSADGTAASAAKNTESHSKKAAPPQTPSSSSPDPAPLPVPASAGDPAAPPASAEQDAAAPSAPDDSSSNNGKAHAPK
jgi:RNA polymerase sigma-70 factor (ECF subfamily)